MTKKGTVGHERQVSAATMSDAFLGEDSVLISTHSFDEGVGVTPSMRGRGTNSLF